jgi:hypothetical protein
MHLTWSELVAALTRLGRNSPTILPGLHARVMRRLLGYGAQPATTQPSQKYTLRPATTRPCCSQRHDL